MKLVASKTSPYARKIRVLLAEKQLAYEFVEESAWNAGTTVPRYNPLNKIPVLVTDDGTCLYDSCVIAEYLDPLGAPSFIPPAGLERALVRRDEALGNGIPTLSSTGGALPEAGGEWAEYFDPTDLDTLVALLERHLCDPAHHAAARARLADYCPPSWEDGARGIVDAFSR